MKKILITGSAGSIGSQLSIQLLSNPNNHLLLLDQSESGLFELELNIKNLGYTNYTLFLFSINNLVQLQKLFENHQPSEIYHTAAFKHVALMEQFPHQVFETNIWGTYQIANLAEQYKTLKMVFISTDKAVRPNNIMGASKRAGELLMRGFDSSSSTTQYISTRFGNVYGSSGSVVPIFKSQIENNQNLTVTHPDMERYFMSINEACQLVISAAKLGKGGELFLFDMGKPILIRELAEKLIQESGKNLKIIYSGIRAGEKLTERLHLKQECLQKTNHPKILVIKNSQDDSDSLLSKIIAFKDKSSVSYSDIISLIDN